MHNNYIKDLLGFKDVIVKKVTNDKENIWIEIKTKQKEVTCPCCANLTSKIHDYRTQIIKDAPIQFKKTYLILRKRRYVCKSCGKKFFEDLDDVRIRVQKNVPKTTRKYIKGSKKLLLARPFNLNTKGLEKVSYILNNFHDDLRTSYIFKEQLLDIAKLRSPTLAKKLFIEWIESAEATGIPELIACTKTYRNWFVEICNSFEVPFSNGVIEGTNNKIKVLKRMAFGFRNFFNFRVRILLCTK